MNLSLHTDVHIRVRTQAISKFMHTNQSIICFRCGQPGHIRQQCLTYKVRLCWHFARNNCTDPRCTFAHSASELRKPFKQRCVRVVKQGDELVCIGCNSTEHTFSKCPYNKDLILW